MHAEPHETIDRWLRAAAETGASDLHVLAGYPPVLRIHGQLRELPEPALDGETVRGLVLPLVPPLLLERFERRQGVDLSLERPVHGRVQRFRMNVFLARGSPGACFRVIPAEIPTLKWAGFPLPLAQQLAHFRNGLVLVTGVAGAGKTTTLAMIINLLNHEGGSRIVTIEEPVEYVFPSAAGSVVSQREVGLDVPTFADGLRHALRQDPDVILVGEIRDRETAAMALSAAETGHLVFATLHTRDAKGAVSRMADFFPQDVQPEIRSQFAMSLRAVISQHLLPSVEEDAKRELALEILFNDHRVAAAIRQGKLETIDTAILTGRGQGMITLNESIKRLFAAGKISR
ncbi:MAG TPA: PilT/PilU family type 4a pilus ATPase, partial [Planctomycetaceae bacterium]|nr:PilT/PilU family type 4a pilus ATPase [Planctomycetaceae bacterium]